MDSFIKKLSVKTLNSTLIFIIVFVFLTVSSACYYSLRRIDTDEFWEIHSYQVSENINILLLNMEDMETGQRGYIITGHQNFLEPYDAGYNNITNTFSILQKLTIDNPVQQNNLITLKVLIDEKVTELKDSMSLRTNIGFDAAKDHILIGNGKKKMDSIRVLIAKMQTEESRLLKIRTEDLTKINKITELIIIIGSIIGFLFYLLVNYIINNFVIGKIVKKSLFDKEQQANKELQSINLAKDEFVSIASHQLRTPLTALKGYTGMLLDGDVGSINEKQREYLSEIKNANDRMIKLITSLLNVSRVDLGVFTVDPELINFEEISQSVLKELESSIKDKKLHIKTNFEKNIPLLSADPKIVRMVFQNLLSNAVKYTPPEGSISLNIKKEYPDLVISVKDTGYGIPEAVKLKIFTKLFRSDNARIKDPNGTGLGLYIIKATIEQTGGKIWFDSKENKGSTFYVSIPLDGMKKKEGFKRLE